MAKQRRWRYVASGEVTPLYMDVFVFDQSRFFDDLVPTLPPLMDRLRSPEQWILRVCMDAVFQHNAQVCSEWFCASSLAEMGMSSFEFHDLPERESIMGNDVPAT